MLSRLGALERRAGLGVGAGPWLSVVYEDGAPAEHVARLEAEALAAYVSERGEPRGEVNYIHRVLIAPRAREAMQ
ncbi:hypothetical protein [Vitreimonas sp.]|uniref:hypothetical protein n=1 Tax=Vitreimonas sp. TaxID=3069702 RepID=UPI002D76C8A7|nr:hypothetical protein [Vitreimonas sp.]